MATSIADIADDRLLRFIWSKYVRARLRSMTLNNFNLCPDPLHYAAYDWGLDDFVGGLARDLRSGQYAPSRGELVRAAKVNGLTRPLCFLTTRDALVYKTITWMARESLVSSESPWVASDDDVLVTDEMQENENPPERSGDSFEWFNFWLARHGGLISMLQDDSVTYIVESDIANFYPSIRLDAVREHLLAQTDLDKEVVRVCVQIIDGVMPRTDYAETSLMGLPQEQLDSSRPIAQSLLLHVDEEFSSEGEIGRYIRYMDDIVLTVSTVPEGRNVIARLQRRLESLGLYPNAAKTRILTKYQCFDDRMIALDLEIEQYTAALREQVTEKAPYQVVPTSDQRQAVVSLSRQHREMATRPKHWNRLTRRLYTLHRSMDIREWEENWLDDLRSDPSSASNILEYVRSWPVRVKTVERLVELSREHSGLYPDISLLSAEVVLTSPVSYNVRLWSRTARLARREFERLVSLALDDSRYERVAAPWLLAAWKYSDSDTRRQLIRDLPRHRNAYSAIHAQALSLVAAEGEIELSDWITVKPGLDWETALSVEYLRSLESKDDAAINTAIDLLYPKLTLTPQRYAVLPRALPLLSVLNRVAPDRAGQATRKALRSLRKNPVRLRDRRLEYLIEQAKNQDTQGGY